METRKKQTAENYIKDIRRVRRQTKVDFSLRSVSY
jgi:hypothetical protein